MTIESTPTPADPAAPPEMTLGEALAAARTVAQNEVAAAQAKLAAVEAKIAGIPASFHGVSWKGLVAEIEGWFTKL